MIRSLAIMGVVAAFGTAALAVAAPEQFDKARQTITDAIKLAPESAAARILS